MKKLKNGKGDIDDLLHSLRQDLRQELQLTELPVFRFERESHGRKGIKPRFNY